MAPRLNFCRSVRRLVRLLWRTTRPPSYSTGPTSTRTQSEDTHYLQAAALSSTETQITSVSIGYNAGLPCIWVSMDISTDIMLAHALAN